MRESRRDPVEWVLWEKVDEFVRGQLGCPADAPECATRRPAPGACCRGEGGEGTLLGKTSGHCQLRWGAGMGPSPSVPLTYPFKMRCLVSELGYYHRHKSVDPSFVLPKDLATRLTRRHLFVHFFIHYSCSQW